MAWAVPDASIAPPAPALITGNEGIDPAVMRIALMTLMVFGCSLVMYSRAVQAFNSQTGACVTVVTSPLSLEPFELDLDRDFELGRATTTLVSLLALRGSRR